MYTPILEINLRKLEENARVEVALLEKYGVEVMAVNKVFNGCVETAKAVLDGGINVIAESRVYNLKKLKENLECVTCLLRSPCLSEIKSVIEYADISLNSDTKVIEALSLEAEKQKKIHYILLMIDMGDLREGIWYENYDQILEAVDLINSLAGVELYGLGTNFNSYGTVLPTVQNGNAFIDIVKRVELDTRTKIRYLSAGNSTSYHLIEKKSWPKELNHLRIGALHEFGIEYVDMYYLDGFHHSTKPAYKACSDLYKFHVEIIELNSKPTVPVGLLGVDIFFKTRGFINHGTRKRALLAFGQLDVPFENCVPMNDNIIILGQTNDYTIIDIEDVEEYLSVGDIISFELDYTGLSVACQSSSINRCYIR